MVGPIGIFLIPDFEKNNHNQNAGQENWFWKKQWSCLTAVDLSRNAELLNPPWAGSTRADLLMFKTIIGANL